MTENDLLTEAEAVLREVALEIIPALSRARDLKPDEVLVARRAARLWGRLEAHRECRELIASAEKGFERGLNPEPQEK